MNDNRAFQTVYLNASVDEVVAYQKEALPAAGFEITSIEGADPAVTIAFTDPEGRSGDLPIRTAASHPSQMGIDLFLN